MIRTVAAPMVAASDYAFRCLLRQCSQVDLTYTQMWHARSMVTDKTFYQNHYDLYEYSHSICQDQSNVSPSQLNLLESSLHHHVAKPQCFTNPPCVAATRGPVMAQLAGNDAHYVVQAAQRLLQDTNGNLAGIDFNLGCPQGIARKGNYGAFFMERHPDDVYAILSALRSALPSHVAVSAKIRLPRDPAVQVDRIRRLCDTGLTFLTVHGRDYTENKATVGPVHVQRLAEAVQTAQEYANVPVIVNGGMETRADIVRLLRQTGAAAVMAAEALLERPMLFATTSTMQHQPRAAAATRFDEQWHASSTYLDWSRYAPPVPGVHGGDRGSYNIVRSHLFKFLYPYLVLDDHMNIDLRDALASTTTNTDRSGVPRLSDAHALLHTLRTRYDPPANIEVQEWWQSLPSSQQPASSWYRRHWPPALTTAVAEPTGATAVPVAAEMVEERKRNIRARIAHLRQSNHANATLMANQTVSNIPLAALAEEPALQAFIDLIAGIVTALRATPS